MTREEDDLEEKLEQEIMKKIKSAKQLDFKHFGDPAKQSNPYEHIRESWQLDEADYTYSITPPGYYYWSTIKVYENSDSVESLINLFEMSLDNEEYHTIFDPILDAQREYEKQQEKIKQEKIQKAQRLKLEKEDKIEIKKKQTLLRKLKKKTKKIS
jgi:hypothetical protein